MYMVTLIPLQWCLYWNAIILIVFKNGDSFISWLWIVVSKILNLVFGFMLYNSCILYDFLITLISHQPISSIVLCFAYRSYIYPYNAVMIVWYVQNRLDFIPSYFIDNCVTFPIALISYQFDCIDLHLVEKYFLKLEPL